MNNLNIIFPLFTFSLALINYLYVYYSTQNTNVLLSYVINSIDLISIILLAYLGFKK